MFRLPDFRYSERTIFLRLDLNSPIKDGRIISDARFRAALPTLRYLVEQGARVVVGTHQGKPYEDDYVTTEEHARILERLLGAPVGYVDDILGTCARSSITSLRDGEVLMLENLRFSAEDVESKPFKMCEKTHFVRKLSPLFDYVVVDAFATAHRSHPSLVGFSRIKPTIQGFLMEREIDALKKAYESPDRPRVYVLGGAKVGDSIRVIKNVLIRRKADVILTGGLVGNIFTLAKGFHIGDSNIRFLEEKGLLKYVETAERVLNEFYPLIKTPVDFAVEYKGERLEVDLLSDSKYLFDEHQIMDIGSRTVEKYGEILADAAVIVANGPMGVFELEDFAVGTVGVFRAIADSKAFSVVGGGHSIASLEKYNIKGIDHISTGGGAMLAFFEGRELPVIRALRESYRRFSGTHKR
ncbi:MAG: phosphoglycerate kinase [Thermococci archaeon]|nr:phosphoglycerate kinase [Thermococci archaeon]